VRRYTRAVRRLALLLAVALLAATGCDTGSDSDSDSAAEEATTTMPSVTETAPAQPSLPTADSGRRYTRGELPKIALQPSDAPRGMRYTRAESGPKSLEQIGILLKTQTRELRTLGYRAVYDSIFDSRDIRLASRIWLFAEPAGAQRWLASTESQSLAVALEPMSAPRLADGSWAAVGNLNGNDLITYAFRTGNVVVVMTLSTQTARLSPADALAAARKAVSRARQ
jgi:hypothetical protein